MNLVMDDFYHAHSQRLLSTEDCGSFVTSSQVGDYTLTRTGNTEESRTGDVTGTITGNVNESIENGSVTINNNLMGKTVTEMMPAGDYKTEVTAMNYETMFMVNGEHKVMDMSTKKTVYDLAITDLTFSNPRSTTDANIVSETFLGVKNSNFLGASLDTRMSVKVEAVDKGPVIGKKAQEIVNINISCVSYSSTIIKSKICINNSNLIMNG